MGRPLLLLGLVLLHGCSLPGRGQLDHELQDLDGQITQPSPPRTVDALATRFAEPRAPAPLPPPPSAPEVRTVAFRQPAKDEPVPEKVTPPERIQVPPELPGYDAPPIPKMLPEKGREKRLADFYPPTPPLPPEPPIAPGPEGRPMTLADLQRLGEMYSPAIKNAKAALEAARGAALQAGMYPNPIFAFENDTLQTGPAGYPGFFIDQVIKTGGKLKLAQAAALMDVLNAKAALRRAQTDLQYSIRGYYFAVLVARENVRVNDALFRFSEAIYQYHVKTVSGSFAGAYEPLQLRPLVLAARLAVIQGRNQYQASWRQLAASMGLPCMPPSELAGRVDMPVPLFDYCQVKDHVIKNHTDVIIAENSIRKAKYNLDQARLVPLPDVDARVLVQKDYTTPPNQVSASVQFSVPVPIWDQNKGGIRQAEALLAQALVGPDQARNTLITTLADAFNRYETGRQTVEVAAQQMADQLRAYRALRERRRFDPTAVGFVDLVTAQQTLAGYIAGYITALGAQWQAVVDVANVLQTDDLFQFAHSQEMLLVPDLGDLEYDVKHAACSAASTAALKSQEKPDSAILAVRWVDPKSEPPGAPTSPPQLPPAPALAPPSALFDALTRPPTSGPLFPGMLEITPASGRPR
jgi:cobalt-zinc-cadmium efflux system outer membrane protein